MGNFTVRAIFLTHSTPGADILVYCIGKNRSDVPARPNDFSDPVDQDIRTQCALSWKIVVSEWRSVIVVSLNVGGGTRLIKPTKLYMCTQKYYQHARRRVCAAMVPYRWATRGTSLRELDTVRKSSNECLEQQLIRLI